MPRRTPDPTGDKERTLRHATHCAKRAAAADVALRNAMRFAHDNGASLREIAEATDIPHSTVKRILERESADRDV